MQPKINKCTDILWGCKFYIDFAIEHTLSRGFPGGASSKKSTCRCRRYKKHWFDPWVKKISSRISSCLKNLIDRGAWRARVHRVSKSWTQLNRLGMHKYMYTFSRKSYSHCSTPKCMMLGPNTSIHCFQCQWRYLENYSNKNILNVRIFCWLEHVVSHWEYPNCSPVLTSCTWLTPGWPTGW